MPASNSPISSLPNAGFQVLVEHFPNGVLVLFDSTLTYRIVGPAVLPFTGRTATEMVGENVHDLFPEETVAILEPKLRATIEGESQSFDVTYGEHIHHLETRPVDIEGEPFGVLATQDVTDEREMAAELEEQNERLDQFVGMISHDLKNPLNIALGRLDLYRQSGDEEHLAAVAEALHRVQELTVDMVTLAKHGRPIDYHDELSLQELTTDAWNNVNTRAAVLETTDGSIEGDHSQIRALFENLFRNAVGHGGDDVTVTVGPVGDGFFVEDTGPGIPPEKRAKVFEHGFTTGYGGSGFGLTIVNRIAESNGYSVTLGTGDAGGARFEFHPDSVE